LYTVLRVSVSATCTGFYVFSTLRLDFATMEVDICSQVVGFALLRIKLFDVFCSLMLFMALRSTIGLGWHRWCQSSQMDPPSVRGHFSQNTGKLALGLICWNTVWLLYQPLSLLYDWAPRSLLWAVIIVKALLWVTSIYVELYTTFFAFFPIGKAHLYRFGNRLSMTLALASGIGCMATDFSAGTPSSTTYQIYDLAWSVARIALVLCFFLRSSPSSSKAWQWQSRVGGGGGGGGGGGKNAASSGKWWCGRSAGLWTLFMVVVYLLESAQRILQIAGLSAFACCQAASKLLYFGGLAPVLAHTLRQTNAKWSASLSDEVTLAARQWIRDMNVTFPGEVEAKVQDVSHSLRSVVWSNISDHLLDERQLKDLNKSLGSGASGDVRLWEYRGQPVAVKFVPMGALLDNDVRSAVTISRFKREFAYFLQAQECPYIVQLIGFFFQVDHSKGPRVGLCLEYARHGSLMDLLPWSNLNESREARPRPHQQWPRHPFGLALDYARGLAFLHRLGYLFVDLKNDNLLIVDCATASGPAVGPAFLPRPHHLPANGEGKPSDQKNSGRGASGQSNTDTKSSSSQLYVGKLADLGSVSTPLGLGCDCACLSRSQMQDQLMLTEAFAAPEVILATRQHEPCPISSKTDIWSFGLILWSLITGIQVPFVIVESGAAQEVVSGKDVLEFYWEKKMRPPIPPSVPATVSALIRDCLSESAHLRPSIDDIITRLPSAISEVERHYLAASHPAMISGFDSITYDFVLADCFFRLPSPPALAVCEPLLTVASASSQSAAFSEKRKGTRENAGAHECDYSVLSSSASLAVGIV